MKIALASRSAPDWGQLVDVIATGTLDQSDNTLRGYTKVLDKILPYSSQDHVFYSFFFEMNLEYIFEIVKRTNLTVSSCEDTVGIEKGFMSGSVRQWYDAIKIFCRAGVNAQYQSVLRAFFTAVIIYLENEGVRFQLTKTELTDKTFHVQ